MKIEKPLIQILQNTSPDVLTSALSDYIIKKHLKDKIVGLKILLTEKEELEHLIEQYETNMSNATSLQSQDY